MFGSKKVEAGKKALVLFPDQLFKIDDLPSVDRIYFIEDPLYFGNDKTYPYKIHGSKIIFLRASMQAYLGEELWPAKLEIDYMENHPDLWSGAAVARAALDGYETIYVFKPNDHRLKERLIKAEQELTDEYSVVWLDLPNFYLQTQEIREFFDAKKTDFKNFYQWQRERFNILIGKDYKPVGGDWMLPEPKPVKQASVGMRSFGNNKYVAEAYHYVENRFSHYHNLPEDFIWPVTREEAGQWHEDFLSTRLAGYAAGSHQLDLESSWSGRSLIGTLLESGLVYPQEALKLATQNHSKKPGELVDLELYVRNILGWREYMRGYYLERCVDLPGKNELQASRVMTSAWIDAQTGLEPVDAIIRKARRTGYISSQERVVMASLMQIIGFHPQNVIAWFREMSIDSSEWQLVTNVLAVTQFAGGKNLLTAQPVLLSSSQLVDMGAHADQTWQEIWDGLYSRFIDMHRTRLDKNVVKLHDALGEDIKRVLGYRAGDFLAEYTVRG
ncbi:cryptochrome/photolyase family protein [Candidatus Saccharibacteria bacterium]|nr:cryptochrome/photolyase family protein [Candidatus Saccharibacteria bacterium]MCB9821164.1 cryptochrome/photolyase family protein [Candidatus Nomurabacteria bacterium]